MPTVIDLVMTFRTVPCPSVPRRELRQQPSYAHWIDDAEFLQGVARLDDPDVSMPSVLCSVAPSYTYAAMRAKITGSAIVDVVIAPDGSVARLRIARSLDRVHGLDDEALAATMLWRFTPGRVAGKPAHVLVTVNMEFRMH